MDVIVAALIILCVFAGLLIVYLRGRRVRDSQEELANRANPNRFDKTLGEVHDMREALRPLHHTRAASRTDPAHRK